MKTLEYIKLILILSLALIINSCTDRNKEIELAELQSNDYRLFQHTNVWELAKAVEDQDLELIEKIINAESTDINTIEPKFGQTLLFLTIANNDFKSFQKLLDLGININIHNTIDSSSAIHFVCKYHNLLGNYIRYMELLIKNDADVNDKLKINNGFGFFGSTPLMIICSSPTNFSSNISMAKLLIENGAEINYIDSIYNFPLRNSLAHSNYDIALFLIKNGAKFRIPMQIPDIYTDKNVYIMEKLMYKLERLDSKEYKDKMELVKYLESKGLVYKRLKNENSPLVNQIKGLYPDTWEEYFKVY